MFKEFKEFIDRGNVVDLAVGIVIGVAFATVVQSFVDDILMPPIGMLMGGVDFTELYINLSGVQYPSLAAATAAGAPVIRYGLFINSLIAFIIVAFAVFLLVRGYMRLRAPAASDRQCPFCMEDVHADARRCSHCTTELAPAA
jgi:large conductance mechanosensitive channel